MKNLTIPVILIIVATALLAADIFFFSRIYFSIRENIERDISSSLTEMDIEELWYRYGHPEEFTDSVCAMDLESGVIVSSNGEFESWVSSGSDNKEQYQSGHRAKRHQFTQQVIREMAATLHKQLDASLPMRVEYLDEILAERMSVRGLHPEFYAVEYCDSADNVIVGNPKLAENKAGYDCFKSVTVTPRGTYYAAYLTPVSRLVLHQMIEMIICSVALIALFSGALIYLWRTTNHLRSLDEMKDSFVNSMTHELKTPIAVAYSATDAMLRYYDTNEAAHNKEYLRIVLRELSKHSAMVEDILSVSMERRKMLDLRMEHTLIGPIVREVADNQKMKSRKPTEINVKISPEEMSLRTDPIHFANIVSNLIGNAVKYSGESVKINVVATESYLKVSDNGIGISSKHIARIFDRFYRVPQKGDTYPVGGHGIGLYYVNNICTRMGWTITATSRLGKGTIFTILFNKKRKR
jgi:signal transduction histidine kinase